MKTKNPFQLRLGFTTSEMLLAIGAMSIVASLVIPLLLSNGSMAHAQDKRNAQMLASICFRAQESGVNFVAPTGVSATLQNLLVGGQAPTGQHFRAIGLTPAEIASASQHLRIQGGNLVYIPGGL